MGGLPGVGKKTHLGPSRPVLKELIHRGHAGLFVDYATAAEKRFQASYNPSKRIAEMKISNPFEVEDTDTSAG